MMNIFITFVISCNLFEKQHKLCCVLTLKACQVLHAFLCPFWACCFFTYLILKITNVGNTAPFAFPTIHYEKQTLWQFTVAHLIPRTYFQLSRRLLLSEGPLVASTHRCWQAENGHHDIHQEAWNSLTHARLLDVTRRDRYSVFSLMFRLVATSKLKHLSQCICIC